MATIDRSWTVQGREPSTECISSLPGALLLTSKREGLTVKLTVHGHLTHLSTHLLLAAVRSDLHRHALRLRIDLGGLVRIDSSGLGALVLCRRMAEEVGASLVIVDPTPMLVRRIREMGLENVLPVEPALSSNEPSRTGVKGEQQQAALTA